MNVKMIVQSKKYEDHNNALSAAIADVAKLHKVPESRVTAVWGDADGEPDVAERSRETILVTIAGR